MEKGLHSYRRMEVGEHWATRVRAGLRGYFKRMQLETLGQGQHLKACFSGRVSCGSNWLG